MTTVQVIDTTDKQFIGEVFDLPTLSLSGVDLPISEDIIFHIQKTEDLNNGLHRFSNPHYVAIIKEI